MIKQISGYWYLVNMRAFSHYPFPIRQDAEDALKALKEDEQ